MIVWDVELDTVLAEQLLATLRQTASEVWSAARNVHLVKSPKSPESLLELLVATAGPLGHLLAVDVTLRPYASTGAIAADEAWLSTRL